MAASEQVRPSRQTGRWSGPARAAGLAAVAALAAVIVPIGVAGATDDGDDLSDLLVDEVDGYELQPAGDPLRGESGPLDWEELGPLAGVDADALPDDTPGYVNAFFSDDYASYALVMGIGIGDLDPSTVLAGAGAGMGQYGEGDELTLPNADHAGVDYEARDMAPPGVADEMTASAAAMAEDEILVMVVVSSFEGDSEQDHVVLDRFVTAQAQFEPAVEDAADAADEPAVDDTPAAPAAPAGPAPRVGDGDEGSGAYQAGLLLSLTLLTIGLGLLVRLIVQRRRTPHPRSAGPGAARWSPSAGGSLSLHGGMPTAPPLPPAAGPPLAPAPLPPRPAPPTPRVAVTPATDDGPWRLPG